MGDYLDLSLYWPLYKLVISIFIFVSALVCFSKSDALYNYNFMLKCLAWFYIFFTIIVLGFRPPNGHLFGDSSNYYMFFLQMQNGEYTVVSDFAFNYLMLFFSKVSPPGEIGLFFAFVLSCYIFCTLWAMLRFFKERWLFPFCFLVFSGFFISYGVNGIRSGLAASVFILGISFKSYKKWFLLALSFLIHSSMLLPIMGCLFFSRVKNLNYYFLAWFVCLLLSVSAPGVGFWLGTLDIFDDKLSMYTKLSDNDGNRFRFDFVLYSLIPLIIAFFINRYGRFYDEKFSEILAVYITANAFWLLIIRVGFSNRFVYLSWFLYGLVLIYPFVFRRFISKQNRYVSVLLMTLFLFNLLVIY